MLFNPDKTNCCGCTSCFHICPVGAISIKEDSEGFRYPQINETKCVKCHKCEQYCPIQYDLMPHRPLQAFAVYSRDKILRQNSSSGGMFGEISRLFLSEDAIIFAAAFVPQRGVMHISNNHIRISDFYGSKYIQSSLEICLPEIKENILQGKRVLFCGTPCQVASVRKFLGYCDCSKLLLVDFICHGVPPAKLFFQYIKECCHINFNEILSLNFRHKKWGWRNFSLQLTTGTQQYIWSLRSDLFFRGFLENLFLRPSCYQCAFRHFRSPADITLGDCWSVRRFAPKLDDDRGVSLCFLNTNRGKEIWRDCLRNLTIQKLDVEAVIKDNSTILQSASASPQRKQFFQDITKMPLLKALKHNLTSSRKNSFKQKIKYLLIDCIYFCKRMFNK